MEGYKGVEYYVKNNEFKTIDRGLTLKQMKLVRSAIKKNDENEHKLMDVNEFIDFTGIEIEREWVDDFWRVLNRQEWILIDERRIEQLGYKNNKYKYRDIGKLLKKHFIEDEDFKLSNEKLVNNIEKSKKSGDKILSPSTSTKKSNKKKAKKKYGGQNRKLYDVKPETFKRMLMKANTKKAKEIRTYFIAIEKLIHLYGAYTDYWKTFRALRFQDKFHKKQVEYERLQKKLNQEQEKLKSVEKYNKELIEYKLFTEKNETVYVTTSKNYALKGLFKIGKTKNITRTRNSTLNTSRTLNDKMITLFEIKTHDSSLLEKTIHTFLRGFRFEKTREFFKCPYSLILKMVEHSADILDMGAGIANEITEEVNNIRSNPNCELKYIEGIDMSIFDPVVKPVIKKKTVKKVVKKVVKKPVKVESDDEDSDSDSEDEDSDSDSEDEDSDSDSEDEDSDSDSDSEDEDSDSEDEEDELKEMLNNRRIKITPDKIKFIVKKTLNRFLKEEFDIDYNTYKSKKTLNVHWMKYQKVLKNSMKAKITGITPWKKEFKKLIDSNKHMKATYRN